jgi:hypothetical protein
MRTRKKGATDDIRKVAEEGEGNVETELRRNLGSHLPRDLPPALRRSHSTFPLYRGRGPLR